MRTGWILPLLLLIGIGIRVYYLVGIVNSPEYDVPLLDARWYHDRATAWAEGRPENELDVFRAPAYQRVIGSLYRAGASWPLGPRIFQFLMGLGSLVLLSAIGNRLFRPPTGPIAAGIALLYYPLVYFEGELLVTSLFLFLSLFGIWMLLRAMKGRTAVGWPIAGLVLGAAAVTRPTLLPLIPFLLLWMVRHIRGRSRFPVVLGLFVAGLALFPAWATYRNVALSGDPVVVASQGGINLYIGNNSDSDGKTATIPGWADVAYETKEYQDNVWLAAKLMAERETGRILSPSEVSRYWTGRTVKWMRSNPAGALRLFADKVYFFLNNHEIPNNRPVASYVRDYAPLLYFVNIGFGLILPLAIIGMFLPGANRPGKELILIFLIIQTGLVIAFFVCARFRLPIVPLFILFAGHTVSSAWSSWRAGKGSGEARFPWRWAIPVLVIVGGISFSGFRDVKVAGDEAELAFARGFAFAEVGKVRPAEREYRRSLAIDPASPRTRINLGGLLARQGRFQQAEDMLLEAWRIDPGYGSFVWNNVAGIRTMTGDLEGAREGLDRAIESDPNDPDVYTNYGNVLLALGDGEGALARFEEALRRGTTLVPETRFGRAAALFDIGRQEEAIVECRELTVRFPIEPMGWALLADLADRSGNGALAQDARSRFRQLTGRYPLTTDLPGGMGRGS